MSSIPADSRLPLIGSLAHLVWNQLDFLEDALVQHGDIFRLDLGITSVIMVASPNLAEDVLIRKPQSFGKGGNFWDTLRKTLGSGLPVSEGDLWRRQRRQMNPEFRRQRLASFRSTIEQIVSCHLDRLSQQHAAINIEKWSNNLTAALTIRLLLGSTMSDEDIERLTPSIETIFDHALQGIIWNRLPAWLPKPGERQFAVAKQAVDRTVFNLIASHEKTHNTESLLGLLIAAANDGGMSQEDIRDQVISIYIGGYETTGSVIAWTLWSLANRPDLVRQLQAEIDQAQEIGDCADGTAPPLLEACIHEGLRLYPPGPLIPRYSEEAEIIGGFEVDKGENVFVAPWLIHRNPSIWPDPRAFRPERFLDTDGKFTMPTAHKLSWLPFGAGQRICIGKDLAIMEMRITLSKFLHRFEISSLQLQTPKVRLSTTISSNSGIFVALRERPHPN